MEIGMVLRNMGEVATGSVLRRCAGAAEAGGLNSIWVTDHVAIPPDEAQGSDGRYIDALAALAFLAAATTTIGLGTSVLILPYRPPLLTAKWIASIQELSGGRLSLGVGVGWMDAEFRALGLDRRRRGETTDATLEFINRCFADDHVESNGQPLLFRPRPARPPIYVGGKAPHALTRAAKFGDGWLPGRMEPEALAEPIVQLNELAYAGDKPRPKILMMTALELQDKAAAEDLLARYADAGLDTLIHAGRYDSESSGLETIDRLSALARPG
jgi:probable F420-dependent oxidoreductase